MSGEWEVSPSIDITLNPPYYIDIEGPSGLVVSVKCNNPRSIMAEQRLANHLAELLNAQLSEDALDAVLFGGRR